MTVCLDTNAYSRMLLPGSSALRALIESADQVEVPAVVIGELAAGFRQGSRAAANFRLLDDFLNEPGTQIAAVDRDIAERYGVLVAALRRNGTPIPTNEIWIAASAMESGARLITYDAHFSAVSGLLTIAP